MGEMPLLAFVGRFFLFFPLSHPSPFSLESQAPISGRQFNFGLNRHGFGCQIYEVQCRALPLTSCLIWVSHILTFEPHGPNLQTAPDSCAWLKGSLEG